MSGQLQAFAEQLQPYATAAAKACRTAAGEASDTHHPSPALKDPAPGLPEGRWRTAAGPSLQPQPPADIDHKSDRGLPGTSTEHGIQGQIPAAVTVRCRRLLPLRSLRSLSGGPCLPFCLTLRTCSVSCLTLRTCSVSCLTLRTCLVSIMCFHNTNAIHSVCSWFRQSRTQRGVSSDLYDTSQTVLQFSAAPASCHDRTTMPPA